jgi:bifunctional UDP-N-acetylglucosamine pyrophosphorylase / glucosamine-1-phosphate N-acetyltransferase
MDKQLAVVILAAGKSTRFKSAKTKVLHELCGKPMLEWVLDSVLPLKPAQIIVVYGTHSAALVEHLEHGYDGHPVDCVLQEPALGTGHALEQALPVVREGATHLLVLPGDAPLIQASELSALWDALRASGTEHAVLTATVDPAGDLGRVVKRPYGTCERIVEAHEAGPAEQAITEINTGIYVFSRNVFDHLRQASEKLGPSASKGEYYLPNVVLVAPTLAVHSATCAVPIGVNDRQQLAEAEAVLQRRLKEHWMREGVTFRLPETTYLHASVRLAPDVEIGPSCVLTGGTRVGTGTRLVQGCLLEHCIVGEHCELRHVRGLESIVENNVQAGPYVNMRPGTVLHDGVKVGNFVETKNADVGAGSKLPHLQYIGDATLGEGCNIGAGTIFCNYDGISKNHTTLGERVFIGSNSSLQGGITIGDDAYVAMASAITRDIPSLALGIARAHQENKEGYVTRLRERLKQRKEQAQQDQPAARAEEG